MNRIFASKIYDQIQFILYRTVFGVIGWIVISSLILCQKKYVSTNNIECLFYGIGSFLLYLWFFFTTNNKTKWKPYNQYTDIAATSITIITAMILVFTVGIANLF